MANGGVGRGVCGGKVQQEQRQTEPKTLALLVRGELSGVAGADGSWEGQGQPG